MSGASVVQYIQGVDGIDVTPDGRISGARIFSAVSAFTELTTNEALIAPAPPVPLLTLSPASPAPNGAVMAALPAGRIRISAHVNGAIQGDAGNPAPLGLFSVWLDGVMTANGGATVGYDSTGATPELEETQFAVQASLAKEVVVTVGPHTVELRWELFTAATLSVTPTFTTGSASLEVRSIPS